MLKGPSPLPSADLLHALASMGHGDDIVLVDAPALTLPVVGDHGENLERLAFYERAAQAFVVVATGQTRVYGNVLLRKGVVMPHG